MQFIKEWATGLVVISIVAAVVFLLAPAGKFEKTLRTAVSIVLLIVIVKPFINLKMPEVQINDFYPEYDGTTIDSENLINHFNNVLENQIIKRLSDAGYNINDVESEIEINNKNEVSVKQVSVYVTEEESKNSDSILKIIKDEYGIIAQVEVRD